VANHVERRKYIRFQMAQFGAYNGHHRFEEMCFYLALSVNLMRGSSSC
jgi:hypothetical protein